MAQNDDEALFSRIADELEQQGYSICPRALPASLAAALLGDQQQLAAAAYHPAGLGHGEDFHQSQPVRSDRICWITDHSQAGQQWHAWAARLQRYLNRRLYLGLFDFESHFSHYPPGARYRRHYDAFRGETNRVLSLVTYLNPQWPTDAGGELVLYADDEDHSGRRVIPAYGTLVLFLSERVPHEVLPARQPRYAIAGWFRVNGSHDFRVDPPC